jgi:hypothetical protein
MLAGVLLSGALMMGASPLVTAAHADTSPTDPTLCFVAAQTLITEALTAFHAGSFTIGDLRSVLVGTASFLGDCLTPVAPSIPPVVIPPVNFPVVPPITLPPFPTFPGIPGFPTITSPLTANTATS